jgi:hypothetical protein
MRKLSAICLLVFVQARVVCAELPVYREIEPGLQYAPLIRAEGPQSIYILKIKLDRPGWHWTTGLGDGRVYGLAATPTIAKASAAALNARLIAAINCDFFAITRGNYQGDPLGLQIVEGEVVSTPSPLNRGAVWFDASGKPHLGRVEAKFRIAYGEPPTEFPIAINEPRPDDKAVLFTPSMGFNARDTAKYDFSTRTTDGRELMLEPVDPAAWHPFQIGKNYQAKVARIREGGNSPLTKKSVILSLGPKCTTNAAAFKVGDTLSIKLETSPDLTGAKNAIGGGEILMQEGKIVTNGKSKDRHPRSIIGWNQEFLYLIVVEGRAPKVAIGMTYLELANVAKELDCTEALNLDGGGSSTLWADGKILNNPSDGTPRLVANALILVELKK